MAVSLAPIRLISSPSPSSPEVSELVDELSSLEVVLESSEVTLFDDSLVIRVKGLKNEQLLSNNGNKVNINNFVFFISKRLTNKMSKIMK